MREAVLWELLRGKWGVIPGVRIMRVENPCLPGTPDVCVGFNGKCAWIELKMIESFPKRASTPVRIDHFTSQQKLWLNEWGGIKIPVFVIIRVVSTGYYVFEWRAATQICEMTRSQWEEKAVLVLPSRGGDWLSVLRAIFKE